MHLKLLALFAAAVLLTACSSDQEETARATGSGTVATGSAPTTQVLPAPGGPTQEGLVVEVGDRIFFGYDQSDIKPEAQATLEALAAWLNTYPSATLTLEGHCDERGSSAYNLVLGEKRAKAVRNYLAELGVKTFRVNIVSYGEERPFCSEPTEMCYQLNRRGHLFLESQ